MKFTASTERPYHGLVPLVVGAILATCFAGGCSKTPATPPAEKIQQTFESQIQAIQNNPQMSDAAKQQAIAGIKAQQAHTTAQQ